MTSPTSMRVGYLYPHPGAVHPTGTPPVRNRHATRCVTRVRHSGASSGAPPRLKGASYHVAGHADASAIAATQKPAPSTIQYVGPLPRP